MPENRWDRIKRIVDEALDEPDPQRRRHRLDAACGEDDELRNEVEELLAYEHGPVLEKSRAPGLETYTDATIQKAPAPMPGPPSGRFSPGTVLSGRYRIIERVGKGGMGEVYHAEDLALDQEVALKFLPPETAGNRYAQKRLRTEVRTARQISHPNVCRVYGFDEVEDLSFISMEYIRGEDLQSLLSRIGRLPSDKGSEIAVQLASGLAAAHDQGVLHRDLKPANVMLDERGRVRITDFGLAVIAGDVESKDVRSGTPAYMAPEQSRGEAVTERSDLYSLGLVLYELFTGEAPFATPAQERSGSRPRAPSSFVEGLDSVVEKTILQCLEYDPAMRPPSAAAVRDRLPGGDRLAAAIARGETPARALVAEAGESTGVQPRVAWACLAVVVVALTGAIWLGAQSRLAGLVPLPKSSEVLVADGRRILAELGYSKSRRDSTYGFVRDSSYIESLLSKERSPDWWRLLERADPGVIRFWYRESPRVLVPRRLTDLFPAELDPPVSFPGMVRIRLDTTGRLRELQAVPSLNLRAGRGAEEEPVGGWETLFASAGFNLEDFTPTEPDRRLSSAADRHVAWRGVYPDAPEIPIRVEAATFGGRVIHFSIEEPWSESAMEVEAASIRRSDVVPSETARLMHVAFNLALVLALPWLAWRSFQSGRGDRELAFRLAIVLSGLVLAEWLLAAHHVADRSQLQILNGGLFLASFAFVLTALLYLVLEPYARKLWPRALVSWVRLLGGRFRDPIVGRDVLAGCVFGVVVTLAMATLRLMPLWLGRVPGRPDFPQHPAELLALRGTTEAVAELLAILVNIATHVMFLFVALLVFRLILRRTWAAVALHATLYVALYGSGFGYAGIAFFITGWHFLFFRFGWLSILVGTLIADVLVGFPLTSDPSSWYAYATTIAASLVLALTLYGFKVSLAGRPAFRDVLDAV